MIPYFFKYIIFYFVILFLQFFIFNAITINEYAYAFVFNLVLFMLPLSVNNTFLLFFAFFSGLLVDISTMKIGVHAFSTVMIVPIRELWLNFITPQLSVNEKQLMIIEEQPLDWHFTYLVPLIFIYSFIYHIFANLGFSTITLFQVISTGIYSSLLNFIFFILFFSKTKK